jgi:hypothetical protein
MNTIPDLKSLHSSWEGKVVNNMSDNDQCSIGKRKYGKKEDIGSSGRVSI